MTGVSARWNGIACALGAAVLFGASTPIAKLMIGAIDPILLAGIMYLGAGLGLLIHNLAKFVMELPVAEAPLRRRDVPWLLAVVFFGGMLGPVLLMLGLSRTSASAASLLLNLEGIATMVIAWVVFRENVDRKLVAGALAIVAGALILAWTGTGFSLDTGGLMIAGACLAWGIDNNFTRKLSSADPTQVVMIKGIAAGAANVAIAFTFGAPLPSGTSVTGAAIVGFFGIGVSLVLFMLGLRHLGTARTGAYFSLAPFIGAMIAIAAIGEPLSFQFAAAAVFMGFGLWLHLAERHDHEHTHEELEHEHAHVHDEHHRHDHKAEISEPHSHWHRHRPINHRHPHYPDLHHRHPHH